MGLVQGGGIGTDEKQGCGPTDEHSCGWGLGDVSPLPADPDSSCPLGDMGVCPTRSAVPSCPNAVAGTALGNGVRRRTSPPSAKACGILRLLGQRFSDVTGLRLGQEQVAGGRGVSPRLRRRSWDKVLSPQEPFRREDSQREALGSRKRERQDAGQSSGAGLGCW